MRFDNTIPTNVQSLAKVFLAILSLSPAPSPIFSIPLHHLIPFPQPHETHSHHNAKLVVRKWILVRWIHESVVRRSLSLSLSVCVSVCPSSHTLMLITGSSSKMIYVNNINHGQPTHNFDSGVANHSPTLVTYISCFISYPFRNV